MFTKSRRRYQKPGTEVTDSRKPPYGSWELNRSSTRAASALNYGAISPGLFLFVRHNLAIRLSWQSESASASLDYRCITIWDFRFNLSRILQQNAIISKRNLFPAVLEAGSPDEGTYKLIFWQGPIFCSVSLFSVQRWYPCCCVQGEINSVGFFIL